MDHEFNAEQNRVISTAVIGARVAALSLFVLAVWKMVAGVLNSSVLGGLVYLVFASLLATWFLRAGKALDAIVKTEGADSTYVVAAFKELERIFRGIRNIQILLIALMVLGLGVAVVAGAAMFGRALH